jgi:hypothetical protein
MQLPIVCTSVIINVSVITIQIDAALLETIAGLTVP